MIELPIIVLVFTWGVFFILGAVIGHKKGRDAND
jgi:hypothetical protein